MDITAAIELLFASKGHNAYFGEPVSQLEHALQAAHLGAAIEDGALESDGNHLDNSHALLLDLRAAFHNLQRMLEAEFKA